MNVCLMYICSLFDYKKIKNNGTILRVENRQAFIVVIKTCILSYIIEIHLTLIQRLNQSRCDGKII
jgi:hypothetical protein